MGDYTLRERMRRARNRVLAAIAHRLPRRLAYWSLIDSGVRHIAGDEAVPDVPFLTVLQRLGDVVE